MRKYAIIACSVALLLPATVASDPAQNTVEVRQLVPGVWLHTSYYRFPDGSVYPANGMLIEQDDGLLMIDTAWGELQTIELLSLIQDKIGLPVVRAVVTHSHGDRLAGVDVLESHGIPVYAHPLTQKHALQHGLAVPDRVLAGIEKPGSVVTVGNADIYFMGAGHTDDNLIVWLSARKVLFGGCAIRSRRAKSAGNTSQADIESWERLLEEMQREFADAKLVVPGHGQPGDMTLIAHTLQMVRGAE